MDAFLTTLSNIAYWVDTRPLDAADVFFMLASAATVFLCPYKKTRDSVIGTILIICWVCQIGETIYGERISAASDVLFDGVFFIVIFAVGGNIMSVVVFSKLITRLKSIWSFIKRPFTFMVKK
ncbi:hypothetical protein JEP98_00500 [Providencia rettgeri]|uniref:hypothetical protein n=1 Tax=Providencia rettgeri TaxID=587 RepID=UPI0018E40DA5|nr:hypothetical protein [Providencia rettgeri]MBI6187642.1 hypothetical protein [Providencia rettgeri]